MKLLYHTPDSFFRGNILGYLVINGKIIWGGGGGDSSGADTLYYTVFEIKVLFCAPHGCIWS